MKTVKLPLFAGVICAVAFCLNAKDIYVDCNDPHASDTAGEGRGGELLPYATIQAAVDAAEVDDTIKVKPGEYKEGYKITPKDHGYRQTNRVYIAKSLRIESTEGAAVTKVVLTATQFTIVR